MIETGRQPWESQPDTLPERQSPLVVGLGMLLRPLLLGAIMLTVVLTGGAELMARNLEPEDGNGDAEPLEYLGGAASDEARPDLPAAGRSARNGQEGEEELPDLPEGAEGSRIALVELQCDFALCDDAQTYEKLLSLTDLWPGRPLTEEGLAAAVHNLNRTDYFARVEPQVVVYSIGSVVVFHLEGAMVIREVVISGNYPLLETEVRKQLFYRVGRRLEREEDTMRRQEDSVRRLFQQAGFFEARVEIRVEELGDKLARVEVVIDKGSKYRLGDIHVRGADHMGPYRVARHFSSFLNLSSFKPGRVRRGKDVVTRLYQEDGFFAVRVRASYESRGEGRLVDVFVDIDEGPRYEVVFSGNRSIGRKDLMEKLTFWDSMDADTHEIERSAEALRKLYVERGYYQCSVEPMVVELGSGVRRILFDIEEGPRMRVDRILFLGNLSFDDQELKAQMNTRERGFISPPGFLVAEELQDDVRILQGFYRDAGFLHVEVMQPDVEVVPEDDRLNIHIQVEEGTRTRVGRIELVGNEAIGRRSLVNTMEMGSGTPFSPARLEDAMGRIQGRYRQAGYPYARLSARCTIPPEDREVPCDMGEIHSREVNLEITIDERVRVVVGEFFVKGNFVTSDWVVGRAFDLKAGDPFDFHKLLQGQARLRRIGLFDSINTTMVGFSETERRDQVGLVVNVEEPKFRFLELATGAQTVTLRESEDNNVLTFSYWADARYIDRNIFGWGKEFLFNTMVGTLESKVAAGYRDPQFLGRDLTFMVETHALLKNDLTEFGQYFVDPRYFFSADRLSDNYNHFELAASAMIQKEIRRGLMGRVRYKVEQVRRRTGTDETVFQAKPLLLTHLMPGATLDFRDSPIHPTRGFYLWTELDYSSALLGSESNNEFIRIMVDGQGYFSLFRDRLISATSFRTRWGIPFKDSVIGFENRFFLGGDGTVRGFPSRSIGPSDDERFLGDNLALIFNQELRYPLGWGFWMATFYDAGTLIGQFNDFVFDEVRHSTGVGVRYLIAGQIPLRMDVARVIGPREGEDPWGWHLALGYAF